MIPVEQIIETVRRIKPKATGLIVITGGEPLAQEIGLLCSALDDIGCYIQIETAGSCWPPGALFETLVNAGVVEIVCSPKTPKIHPKVEEYSRAMKYIVRSGDLSSTDGLPVASTQAKGAIAKIYRPTEMSGVEIFLQPMMEYHESGAEHFEKTKANTKAAADACIKHGYRLSVQMHKVIGLP